MKRIIMSTLIPISLIFSSVASAKLLDERNEILNPIKEVHSRADETNPSVTEDEVTSNEEELPVTEDETTIEEIETPASSFCH